MHHLFPNHDLLAHILQFTIRQPSPLILLIDQPSHYPIFFSIFLKNLPTPFSIFSTPDGS